MYTEDHAEWGLVKENKSVWITNKVKVSPIGRNKKKASLGERKTIKKNQKINQPEQTPSPQEINMGGLHERYSKYNTKSGFQSNGHVFVRSPPEAQLGLYFKKQILRGNLRDHLMVSVWIGAYMNKGNSKKLI